MKPYIPANTDFIEAGMAAWNALTKFIGSEENAVYTNPEEFEDFYVIVMSKLLEETESE